MRQFYKDPGKINQACRYDVETTRKDGSAVLLGVTLSPLRDEAGAVTGVVGTFQDLTKIRRLEEEVRKRQKLAMIGQMAADMAHEIRNPLASLSGSMQVLRKELTLGEENQRLMEIALRETDRLDNIITEFLYYARPSPLNCKPCDLHALIVETLQLLKHGKGYDRRVEIKTTLADPPLTAWVDADQMRQVFWNLSINAIEAMNDGGVLAISSGIRESGEGMEALLLPPLKAGSGAEEPVDEQRFLEIAFEDTGGGIKREYLDRIFDPFFTTKSHGSGLGLAIVHRIIADHSGHIWADSLEGRGTRFTLLLPIKRPAES